MAKSTVAILILALILCACSTNKITGKAVTEDGAYTLTISDIGAKVVDYESFQRCNVGDIITLLQKAHLRGYWIVKCETQKE